MKSHSKRIDYLESLYSPPEEKPAAHVALVNKDGTVTVKKPNDSGSFQLPNEEALQAWMKENEMSKTDCLKVVIVNSQGKKPEIE